MLRLGVALIAALALGVPAAADAALPVGRAPSNAALAGTGVTVAWPLSAPSNIVSTGAPLIVAVTAPPSVPVRLELVRVDGRGKALRRVSARRVPATPVSVVVPPRTGAHYSLRLQIGTRRFWSFLTATGRPVTTSSFPWTVIPPIPVPASWPSCVTTGPAGVEIAAAPATVTAAGGVVRLTLHSTGERCLEFGAGADVDRALPDGTWERVPQTIPVPAIAFTLLGGATTTVTAQVPAGLSPGAYRLTKSFRSGDDELVATAPTTVLP